MKHFFLVFIFSQVASALEPLIFASNNRVIEPLNLKTLNFISDTLHNGKLRLDLRCEVKVREIKDERKFSDGVHIVEMLEIDYSSGIPGGDHKFFIATGAVVTHAVKSSERAGSIEEFILESDDDKQSRFIFHHNGRGEIIWMSFENDLVTDPCRFR